MIGAGGIGLLAFAAWRQTAAEKKAAAIDAVAAKYVKAGKSPALAVGVMQAGKIVLARGYGLADIEKSTPATPDTIFRINSMTKQFTAAGILLLAERGKLRTDAALAQFFPAFPRAREITVKQLLTHTAGLASYDAKPEFRTRRLELQQLGIPAVGRDHRKGLGRAVLRVHAAERLRETAARPDVD